MLQAITMPEAIKCKLQFQRGHIGQGGTTARSAPELFACCLVTDETGGVTARTEYHGPWDCVKKVWKTEGVRGLFRGYSAVLLRDVPFNFFFFGAYEFFTSGMAALLDKPSKNELNPLLILTCGGFAGATGWSVVFPADVIKSRMQTSSASGSGALSFRGAIRTVHAQHGLAGFYKGWSAAVLRSFPANGSLFMGVELTHRFFRYLDAKQTEAEF